MANNNRVIKSSLDLSQIKVTLEYLKTMGKPFECDMTNYTVTIKSDVDYKFFNDKKSVSFFGHSKALKKVVLEYLELNSLPIVDTVHYYDIDLHDDFFAKEVVNIDLTSAYLYVLKNEGIINNAMFDKLNKVPKKDRLAIVGMLASTKSTYYFDIYGQIQDLEIKEHKELRNVFFYCVNRTHRIMHDIKTILQDRYIFSWVDGVYFHPDGNNIDLVKEYLNNINYPFKMEILNSFEYYCNERDVIEINFLKDNDKKEFKIPKKKNSFAKELYYFINKQNEQTGN